MDPSVKTRIAQYRSLSAGWSSLIFTMVVLVIFQLAPSWADTVYRGICYPVLRMAWDYSIGLLPFPLIYLILISLPFAVMRRIRRAHLAETSIPWSIAAMLAGWVSTFFWLWGFHYSCSDLYTTTNRGMTDSEVLEMGLHTASRATIERARIARPFDPSAQDIEKTRLLLTGQLHKSGRSTLGNPGFHYLSDHGFIRRLGITGIYFPYSCEGYGSNTMNTPAGLFVAAHELSHAYGIAQEGEADFLAWKALRSDTAFSSVLRYAAELELLRSIRGLLRETNDSLWKTLIRHTSSEVNQDIVVMQTERSLYPEFWPGAGQTANDQYLKLMGNPEGIRAYDRFVELVFEYGEL